MKVHKIARVLGWTPVDVVYECGRRNDRKYNRITDLWRDTDCARCLKKRKERKRG